jgi:hypothetical protein
MNKFAKGLSIQITGVILFIIGLVCLKLITPLTLELGNSYLVLVVSFVLSLGLLSFAVAVYNKGRRLRLPSAAEVLAKKIPHVLYLRSFESQTVTNQAPSDDIHDALELQLPLLSSSSEEEKLAKALRVIGPGLTVGTPGEKISPFGFIRVYIVNNDWMSEVEKLMTDARLVVIRIGDTPGVVRELERARQLLPPERIVLLLPEESFLIRDPGEMDTGIQLLSYGPYGARDQVELCPGVTVPILKRHSTEIKYSVAAIVYFDSDWVAHPRPLGDIVINFTHAIDKAFKPVYKQLGVRKGIRLYQVMIILSGILGVGLMALFTYGGRK